MSWLKSMNGEEPPRYVEPADTLKVKDPSIPNRMVSDKAANQPYLQYAKYREEQKALHESWLERKKLRDEKIARGEEVGPEEPDPTAQKEVGIWGIIKFLFFATLVIALAGKFFTGSYTWQYQSKWTQLKTYWPGPNQRLFSERMLQEFDGTHPDRPIYLAIDGDVYDVTEGKSYQPGGSYAILAGVDAARAFGTGCFKTHRTHDLRGLSESELQGVQHWKKFYAEGKYPKVGRVSHPPIDPNSPIPEHCNPKKIAKEEGARKETPENPHKHKGGKKDEL